MLYKCEAISVDLKPKFKFHKIRFIGLVCLGPETLLGRV
jgi:hypothetical protein